MQDKFLEKAKQLNELAKSLDITMAQLSIGWCIRNPNVSSAILGATNRDQLLENLKALEASAKLDEAVMQKIEDIVQTKPQLPEY